MRDSEKRREGRLLAMIESVSVGIRPGGDLGSAVDKLCDLG